jgi:hypothetical protein
MSAPGSAALMPSGESTPHRPVAPTQAAVCGTALHQSLNITLGRGGNGAKWWQYSTGDRKATLEQVIGGVAKMQASS